MGATERRWGWNWLNGLAGSISFDTDANTPLQSPRRPTPSDQRPVVDLRQHVTREQVRIDIRDGKLTLQGRREARVSCEQYHQVERGHGEFCRSVVLPLSVDTPNVVTDMRDGVLTITLPKLPDAGPRRIEVS